MSAVLRASGSNFDVDAFTSATSLKIITSFRKGEPRTKKSRKLRSKSGLNIDVSDADFDNLKQQIDDTIRFFKEHEAELSKLRDSLGLEHMCVDFGAEIYPPGWSWFSFPHELLLLAGKLRIDLDLSVYPTDPDQVEAPKIASGEQDAAPNLGQA